MLCSIQNFKNLIRHLFLIMILRCLVQSFINLTGYNPNVKKINLKNEGFLRLNIIEDTRT